MVLEEGELELEAQELDRSEMVVEVEGGAPQAQAQLQWYHNSALLISGVMFMLIAYDDSLCGVSALVSVQPVDTLRKYGSLIWALFWLIVVPVFVIIPYVNLWELAATIKQIKAVNQANEEGQNAAALRAMKANAWMMWVSAFARIVYLVVRNSWPLVAIACSCLCCGSRCDDGEIPGGEGSDYRTP